MIMILMSKGEYIMLPMSLQTSLAVPLPPSSVLKELAAEPLQVPMVPSNYEAKHSLCFLQDRLKVTGLRHASASYNFHIHHLTFIHCEESAYSKPF